MEEERMIELKFSKRYDNYHQQPYDKKGLKKYCWEVYINEVNVFTIARYNEYLRSYVRPISSGWSIQSFTSRLLYEKNQAQIKTA